MRFRLGWTVALLIGAAGAAPAQTPLVYRIDISGTVENGLAPELALQQWRWGRR